MTGAALLALVILAWAYLLAGGGLLPSHGDMMRAPPLAALIAMWWVMMVAMMVPSAAPTILLFGQVHRARVADSQAPTAAFLAGYLVCWLAFSLVISGVQLILTSSTLVSPMAIAIADPHSAGGLLVAAGLYQLSPLKQACLGRCRSPAAFLARYYRPGLAGALAMGVRHGAYCVGCCWLLMALLFVGGVMNFAWIAALTLLVAGEKFLPGGDWLARIAGAALVAWGAILLLA